MIGIGQTETKKEYYDSGELEYKETYKNGKLQTQNYYDKDGSLISSLKKEYLKDGNYATLKHYYKNGKLKEDATFRYPSNLVWKEIAFKAKLKVTEQVGVHRQYYENGKLGLEEYYENNKQEGEYRTWFENGKLRDEGNYKNGERIGLWTSYYYNSNILIRLEETNFEDMESKSTCWDENGNEIECE